MCIIVQTTLKVKGMTCVNCEKAVKKALETVSGVSSVVVHLDKGNVEIDHNENEVTIDTLKQTIESQGYEIA